MYSVISTYAARRAEHITTYAPFCLLAILFITNLALFWPGQMTGDSHFQYEQAQTNSYTDWHPPIMAAWWRVLDKIYPGPGLLFVFHLILLYAATLLFMASVPSSHRWFMLMLPLMPPIPLYSSMIWKDVGFALAYLFAAALLMYLCMQRKKITYMHAIFLALALFYGTAAKFQAQYIVPIFIFGIATCLTNFRITKKTWLYTLAFSAILYFSLNLFNNYFVPEECKTHAWQQVKLYDLAGISLAHHGMLFPDFVKNNPFFSEQAVRERFNYERVDDLTGFDKSPLRGGITEQERQELYRYWCTTVMTYPLDYLRHRAIIWFHLITHVPLERLDQLDFSSYQGLGWFCDLQKNAQQDHQIFQLGNLKNLICIAALKFLKLARYLFCMLLWLPLLIFYFLLSIKNFGKNSAALPLFVMTGLGLGLLGVLFFMSMATNYRYIYCAFCMLHASHLLAYYCWKGKN
jgi:hypothetical protein